MTDGPFDDLPVIGALPAPAARSGHPRHQVSVNRRRFAGILRSAEKQSSVEPPRNCSA
jgi:hypothetical protein